MRIRDSRGRFVKGSTQDLTAAARRGMLLRVAFGCFGLAALGLAVLFT